MNFIHHLIDFILHIDVHLKDIVSHYHTLTYLILALIIFCETGLVVTPFLPGDSLLFAAGTLAGAGYLHIGILIPVLLAAAILGDNLNFTIGKYIGHKLIGSKRKIIKKEYLDKTHSYYQKHGGKTVIIARFIPIVRTFAPFVAGLGSMIYRKFIVYCISGNLLWIFSLTLAGFLLGSNEWIKNNFTLVTLGIIGFSMLPILIGIIKTTVLKNKSA